MNLKKEILCAVGITAIFMLFSFALRLTANGNMDLTYYKNMMLFSALGFALLYVWWHGKINFLISFLFFITAFLSAAYVKEICFMKLNGRELIYSLVSGTVLFCLLSFFYGISCKVKSHGVRLFFQGIIYAVGLFCLLFPMLIWGYYIVSGQLLSSAILLTLFQTNMGETMAYLRGQEFFRWVIAAAALSLAVLMYVWIFQRMAHDKQGGKQVFTWSIGIYLCIIFVYSIPYAVNSFAFKTAADTVGVLREYKEYGADKEMRIERLRQLNDLSVEPRAKGIYVLIIGESESRDHMHLYGYDRDNTPWMDSMNEKTGTVVFKHAYSNHTHTVPVLTYALSEKNQYNDIKLQDAYSLIEIAKASGYDTYWISNQRQYGAWDTPIAEIASTADHQVWINGNVGTRDTDSLYYDDELVKRIPDLSGEKNVFIVFHLMGSHGYYGDRYPLAYNRFSGKIPRVDQYDNSVLYSDEVIHEIYSTLSAYPNFQGLVYFSDHGDDADAGKGHESTKFTYTMSHIPLFMAFSKEFLSNRIQTYEMLQAHSQDYWTNDLLYNVMVHILGIQGIPHFEPKRDLASPEYDGNPDHLYTLHGEKKISDDPVIREP